jgi:hypothetical protein
MAYWNRSRFLKFEFSILVVCLLIPGICLSQNAWNTELIGKAAQDGSFFNFRINDNHLYAITRIEARYQLTIVDISNPSRPNRLWSIARGNIESGIVIFDNFLYLMAPNRDSILVYSLNDPSLPIQITGVDIGITTFLTDPEELNDNLFASYGPFKCYIIDVENRMNPRLYLDLSIQTIAKDLLLIDNYLYIVGSVAETQPLRLEIYDISDTLNPPLVYYDTLGSGNDVTLEKIGNYLYLTSRSYGTRVFDISVLSNPVLIDTVLNNYRILDLAAAGENALMVGLFDSLFTVDVSDPVNPIVVGARYDQSRSDLLRIVGNKLYYRTDYDVFQMYDITDPISPVLEGRYLVYARSLDVAKWGNYVYTREYNGGFRIFDISDPAEPFGMGYYDTDDYTHEIQIDNGTLFLGDGFQGTLIFSLTDPANPMLLSAIDGLVLSMFTSDSLLFIGNSGIDMYNISDPSNPVLLGQYAGTIEDHYYRKIISYGDYVYAAEDDSGNCVYDFSDPDNPSKISCFDSVVSRDFFIQDTLLFSSDQIEGMKIFDIGDPNSPDLLSTTPPDQAYSVCAYGDYAYLVYKNDPDIGFRTFDITVPSYPVLVGTFDNFGSYNGVYAENVFPRHYLLKTTPTPSTPPPPSGIRCRMNRKYRYRYTTSLASGLRCCSRVLRIPASISSHGTLHILPPVYTSRGWRPAAGRRMSRWCC